MQTFFKSTPCFKCFKSGWFRGAKRSAGFTVLEFAVVMVIATIITTVLVIQHNKWNDYLAVKTQAYELSLMIRQAQIWSLGVRVDAAGSGDRFGVGYGVRIDSISGSNNRFYFFVDRDANNKLNVNSQDEEILAERKNLTRGVVIQKVCGIRNGTETCSPSNSLDKIDISFFRPNPRAIIKFLRNQACGGSNSCTDAAGFSPPASIYLISPGGNIVSVKIESSGQISIQ